MEHKGTSPRRLWRILLPAQAAVFALAAVLRASGALSFRMAYLALMILLFVLLDAAVFALFYDRRNRGAAIYRRKRAVLLILLLIALLASAPLFTNYIVEGHDIQFHLFRIEGVRDGLLDGQFPVRIHPGTLYGNGYANPVFYPELLLYVPALLRLCGFSVMGAYKAFVFLLNLLTALISYYACARIFRSVKLGVIGSAFYTLSLYRLVNLYTRAAIGEASAMAFLPLVAVGTYAILFDDTEKPAYKRAFLPLLLGMTGLVSTHLLSCEMALPILAIFCLVFWRRTFTKARLLSLLTAAVGTVLLSLAFVVPMLDYMGHDTYRVFDYSTMNMSREAVNIAQLFPLFPNAVGESNAASLGAAGEMPLGVGFAFLAILLLYPALLAVERRSDAPPTGNRRAASFAYFASLALLFMSTNLFPWQRLYDMGGAIANIAGMLQFPWRLLSLVTLLLTCIACRCFSLLASCANAPLRRALAVTLCLLFAVTAVAYFDNLIQTADALFIHTSADLDQKRSVGDAEYLPVGTAGAEAYRVNELINIGEGLRIEDFARNGTTVTFLVENAAEGEQTLDIPLIYYLGYRAYTGGGMPLAITKGEAARIRVTIPAGLVERVATRVTIRFAERPLWRAAEAVTLLTALSLAAWYVLQRRKYGGAAIVEYEAPIAILE